MMRILLAALLALAACDPPDPNWPPKLPDAGTDDGGVDPAVAACRSVIAAKESDHPEYTTWSSDDLPSMATKPSGVDIGSSQYYGHYREIADGHPGCKPRDSYDGKMFLNGLNEAQGLAGVPVQGNDADKPGYVPGYPCAAKEYSQPDGVSIDPAKPIVVLVHGNSSTPNSWEEYANSHLQDQDPNEPGIQLKTLSQFEFTADSGSREMLASKLVKLGFRVIAVDFRVDLVPTLAGANPAAGPTDPGYGDGSGNVDHGWSVPILQSLLKALMAANPDSEISLVGHSLGYTVIQDSLRRLYKDYQAGRSSTNPFTRVRDVVLASGAAHGVNGGKTNCAFYKTMRGSVNCEMGDRDNWVATDFNKLLDGPDDLFSTPCADGSFAYGADDQCGGHVVRYTTITMRDPDGGKLQDEFVSEGASRLNMDQVETDASGKLQVVAPACVDNHLVELTDFDSSGFFMDVANLNGFLANHFGSVRSDAGMAFVVGKLSQ